MPKGDVTMIQSHRKYYIMSLGMIICIGIYFHHTYSLCIQGSKSMEPSFRVKELFVVNKRAYKNTMPERWDVVLYMYPKNTNNVFLGRIIALPNEYIKITQGDIRVNNEVLSLPGILNGVKYKPINGAVYGVKSSYLVPDNSYYILGDNADVANDSRMFGSVSKGMIKGKVVFK